MFACRLSLLVVMCCCWTLPLAAQPSPTPSSGRPSAAKPFDMAQAATGVRSPQFPGYELRQVLGFTLVISDESLSHFDDAEYRRKPLEVLEHELRTITTIMRPEAVVILRKLLIFVEWDKLIPNPNGRPGGMAAFYSPKPPEEMAALGFHPMTSKNITIAMLKNITGASQGELKARGCVLLHEMTHAVHDRFFGFDHAPIKAAYQQAMERKAYDLSEYLTSNEKEFFACLTETYFDQSPNFPRNRTDLKKHDPVTFALMESCWGKLPESTAPSAAGVPAGVPAPEIRLEEINFGAPLSGDSPDASSLKGKPVLVVAFHHTKPQWVAKAKAWQEEWGDFGLTIVALHLAAGEPADAKSAVESRGGKFTITERGWGSADIVRQFGDFPRAFLFDHAGRCLFGGSPYDVDTLLRGAVVESLLADLGAEPLPKQVAAIASQLRGGKSPTAVLPLTAAAARSTDVATRTAGAALLTRLTAGGERRLAEAEALSAADPVEAFVKAVNLPKNYLGTTVASRATSLLAKLKRDKAVLVELQAQPALQLVQKLDTQLTAKPGSFDPTLEKFRIDNAQLLQQLQLTVAAMKRTWPTSRSTEEALRIAQYFNVTVP